MDATTPITLEARSAIKPTIAFAAVTLLLTGALVSCGGDRPAVCSSVDDLKTSVDNIKDIDVTASGGVSELQAGLTTVESDFANVKADAKAEFTPQFGAVETALGTVKTSVAAAKAGPTPTTLSAVGAALSGFNTALQTLTSDVKSTC